MYSPLLGAELREENLLSGYFFYGEETFPADQFVDQLRELFSAGGDEEFRIERFYLEETRWMDIIDTARTVPFLFQRSRVLVVRMPERKEGGGGGGRPGAKGGGAGGDEERGTKFLSAGEQKILRDYFAAPAAKTVLIVIMPGKARKTDSVVKFFSSLPKASFLAKELKALYPDNVKRWAERKAQTLGKALTEAAKTRLFEIIGSDLRLMDNEIEKLALFVGDKRIIDDADVEQATAWVRSYEVFDLEDVLMNGELDRGLAVLKSLFDEGDSPELIVGRLASFFRNVLAAQTWLRDKEKDADAVFQTFYPYILKTHGDLYSRKFRGFLGVVNGLTPAELNGVLQDLRRADMRIKSSDPAQARTTIESFLEGYCLLWERKRAAARSATSRR